MRRITSLVCLCAICLTLSGGCNKPDTGAGVKIGSARWTVELATNSISRARGLSGRTTLPDGYGMLFVFTDLQVRTFWMRGCLIPLDVAFIDADLRIVQIHTMAAEPGRAGEFHYSSVRPARYALEVPAGGLARAGVKVGDKVSLIGNIPTGS